MVIGAIDETGQEKAGEATAGGRCLGVGAVLDQGGGEARAAMTSTVWRAIAVIFRSLRLRTPVRYLPFVWVAWCAPPPRGLPAAAQGGAGLGAFWSSYSDLDLLPTICAP
jgi:hypothetical protein